MARDNGLRCSVPYIDEDRVRQAQAGLVDGLTATRLAETFKALSDPTRVRIISALSNAELRVCDIAATLGMSQSAISPHFRRPLCSARPRRPDQNAGRHRHAQPEPRENVGS